MISQKKSTQFSKKLNNDQFFNWFHYLFLNFFSYQIIFSLRNYPKQSYKFDIFLIFLSTSVHKDMVQSYFSKHFRTKFKISPFSICETCLEDITYILNLCFKVCRLITVMDNWALTASFFWLLVEGVQLYTLLVVTVLSVKKYFYGKTVANLLILN